VLLEEFTDDWSDSAVEAIADDIISFLREAQESVEGPQRIDYRGSRLGLLLEDIKKHVDSVTLNREVLEKVSTTTRNTQ